MALLWKILTGSLINVVFCFLHLDKPEHAPNRLRNFRQHRHQTEIQIRPAACKIKGKKLLQVNRTWTLFFYIYLVFAKILLVSLNHYICLDSLKIEAIVWFSKVFNNSFHTLITCMHCRYCNLYLWL